MMQFQQLFGNEFICLSLFFLCIIILDSAVTILSFTALHLKSVLFFMSKRKRLTMRKETSQRGGQSVRGRIKHNKKGERAKLRNRSNK